MPLNSPFFWYDKSIMARLCGFALTPFSLFWMTGHKLHTVFKKPYKANVPVICIGNIVAGGSGKTPVTLAIMQLVLDNSLFASPCFLSRGYGGSNKKPVFVDHHTHSFEEVGDEPLLLSRMAPTIVSRDRRDGVITAEKHKHQLVIMDDGLQNPSLAPDLSFLVIDGNAGFGNRLQLPAGPLRESLKAGLAKVDACILIGEDRHDIMGMLPQEMSVFKASLKVDKSWLVDRQSRYIAFSGLGRPEKFRETILQEGLDLVGWHKFPDHHPYTVKELQELDREARTKQARLLTTAKDAVRIPADFHWTGHLDIMPVKIEWQQPDQLTDFIRKQLKAAAS